MVFFWCFFLSLVTQADKTTTGSYAVTFYKEAIGCRIVPVNAAAVLPKCPLCLSPPHRPTRAMPETDTFCYDCVKLLTRAGNQTPFSRRAVTGFEADDKGDKAVAGCVMKCVWAANGCTVTATLQHLGGHACECTYCLAQSQCMRVYP